MSLSRQNTQPAHNETIRLLRVLILDDDPIFGRQLEIQLKLKSDAEFACDTIAVTTAADAYAAAQQATPAFDVFLVDQRLGPGPDGITVLEQLLAISPSSSAIVFTMAGDFEAARRAHQAGAYRYVHKPFHIDELLLVLQTLADWRQTRTQLNWLQVINGIAEDAQRLYTREKIERAIVERGLAFGFDRAQLWLVTGEERIMRCAAVAGEGMPDDTRDQTLTIDDSPYFQTVSAGQVPVVFDGLSADNSLRLHSRTQQETPPQGEWVGLPLWAGGRLRGILVLDRLRTSSGIRSDASLCQALELFTRQVAAALERAFLHAAERRKTEEAQILAEIGRLISSRAAADVGIELLEEVRQRIGTLLDVDTFLIAMRSEERDFVETLIEVEAGRAQTIGPPQPAPGLLRHVIEHNQPLCFASRKELHSFCRQHDIKPLRAGRSSHSWLAVPLQVEGRAVGAIVVRNTRDGEYHGGHIDLLSAIAQQIAGSLHSRQLRRIAEIKSARSQVIQQATQELMTLDDLNTDRLWHTTLTIITAGYGLGFNIAVLFRPSPIYGWSQLRGRLGIGQRTLRAARQDWRADEDQAIDLQRYLMLLKGGELRSTPIDQMVQGIEIDMEQDSGVFGEVLATRQRRRVLRSEIDSRMPAVLREQLFRNRLRQSDYEVAPILVGDRPIAIVLMGNPHLHRPLDTMPLSELDAWLHQVGLVHESWRQRRAGARLATVSQGILASAAEQPLPDTLRETCRAARVLMVAAAVAIIPLDARDRGCFDLATAAYDPAGYSLQQLLRPQVDPFLHSFLHQDETWKIANPESEDLSAAPIIQSLCQREGISACLMVVIRDRRSGQAVGLLLINYRNRRHVNSSEIERACSFADLAGEAIRASRVNEQQETERRERNRQRAIISDVLTGALELRRSAPRDIKALSKLILQAGEELLDQPDTCLSLSLHEWHTSTDEPRQFRRHFYLRDGQLHMSQWHELDQQEQPEQQLSDTLAVPIKLDGIILGEITAQSQRPTAFSTIHNEMIGQLAHVTALVLDSIRTQQWMRTLLEVTEPMVAAGNLHATLEEVKNKLREVADDVSVLTIWYWDEDRQAMVPGIHHGVHYPERFFVDALTSEHTLLGRLRSYETPLWADDVRQEPLLNGRFVREEGIASSAAFPLHSHTAANDKRFIGALFVGYRHRHTFTRLERALLPIFAAVVAACIRDAQALDQLSRQHGQLEKEQERLQAALAIMQAVGATIELDATLRAIMCTLRDLFANRAGNVQICVLTCDEQERFLAFTEVSREFYPWEFIDSNASFPIDAPGEGQGTIAARVARRAKQSRRFELENIADIQADPDYVQVNASTRSQISLALMSSHGEPDRERRLLGVLVLESDRRAAFDEDAATLIEQLGPSISIVIERVRQNIELRFTTAVADITAGVADIAHDINGEIANIQKDLYMLRQELNGIELRRVQRIAESIARLRIIANAQGNIEQDSYDLNTWLPEHVQQIMRDRGNTGVQISFTAASQPLPVQVPKTILNWSIRHLVSNALRHMGNQGSVSFAMTIDNGHAHIQVRNSGPDIPPDIRRRLFRERISSGAPDDAREGGRGLLLTRWMLQNNRCRIDLISAPGEQVTFGIWIPLWRAGSSVVDGE